MKEEFELFTENWIEVTAIWSKIALACSGLILIFYLLLLLTKRNPVKKHQFISSFEIKYLSFAGVIFTIGATLYLNTLLVGFYTKSEIILTMKTMVSIFSGFLIGYIINTYLKVLYPTQLEKRLNGLRFKQRYNPNTGHELRLLTEDEEDEYLTEELINLENSSEYEYDVWLDEESGFKLIETYAGKLHMLICDNCNYRTAKEYKQDVSKEPTDTKQGAMIKHYKCSHCDHLQRKEYPIPALFGYSKPT
ncbi:MAG: hypothetical protein GY816_21230 [Cytophagales bacterium]|nr:hypothetical protein [Cytophagales bacterium]